MRKRLSVSIHTWGRPPRVTKGRTGSARRRWPRRRQATDSAGASANESNSRRPSTALLSREVKRVRCTRSALVEIEATTRRRRGQRHSRRVAAALATPRDRLAPRARRGLPARPLLAEEVWRENEGPRPLPRLPAPSSSASSWRTCRCPSPPSRDGAVAGRAPGPRHDRDPRPDPGDARRCALGGPAAVATRHGLSLRGMRGRLSRREVRRGGPRHPIRPGRTRCSPTSSSTATATSRGRAARAPLARRERDRGLAAAGDQPCPAVQEPVRGATAAEPLAPALPPRAA
jgi:hypothetical protein